MNALNRKTLRLSTSEEDIEKAGQIIRNGGLVAFPTETVYGLGADALNEKAVKSIYQAKGRPSDNPMIVHISDFSELDELIDASKLTEIHKLLMDKFWPGPITFVFKKSVKVPYTTTGGLETVGIRMPSDIVARKFISSSGRPIAAPSANISGRPSPTTYKDVLEDMDGRIDAVIKGSCSDVGIESTVLDLTGKIPSILRPGYITAELIYEITGIEVAVDPALLGTPDADFRPKAPGMKYKHYSPRAEVIIVDSSSLENEKNSNNETKFSQSESIKKILEKAEREGRVVEIVDYNGDSRKAAHEFFARLRDCDRRGVDIILVTALDDKGLGFSVMNRMMKSAGYSVVHI